MTDDVVPPVRVGSLPVLTVVTVVVDAVPVAAAGAG